MALYGRELTPSFEREREQKFLLAHAVFAG